MPAAVTALTAPAKINLALHVTGRRADGYHLLDSIAVFADTGDRIEIRPSNAFSLEISGPFGAHAPGDSTDLAHRAAEAFFHHTALPSTVAIRLEKNIPAGAGLGGGSADAAAVLTGLNRHLSAGLSDEKLRAIGLALGADVPMCLAGCALRARGIGEEIEILEPWPALPMVLIWPARAVSTAQIFTTLARRDNPPLGDPPIGESATRIVLWLAGCRNDLEAPAKEVAPEIGEALDALRGTEGCLLARMSGSGSACFGLFADGAHAARSAKLIHQAHSQWWVVATEAA
jgi:4-diphosphocytidyl-2-C-methyl-D-erythritol kinase